jgi:Sulfotransferase domain
MKPAAMNAEIRSQLRWVKVLEGTDLSRFPDFFIVGPQRTGTSWLYSHLRFHPDILLSRPKEIFFFSSLRSRDPRRFVTDHLEWYLRFFRDPVWLWAIKTSVCMYRYHRLYRPRILGESTASYASLAPDVIDDIVRLNPAIKVILMVRNPVERAWSDAKYYFERRQRRIADVPAAELKAFFTDEYQLSCSRYSANYDNWSSRALPGHLLLARFEDIAVRPERMMLDIMRFIGARDDPSYVSASITQAVNTTSTSRISAHYRQFLEELFEDELNRLRDRFGFAWTGPAAEAG